MTNLNEMWKALESHQPIADKNGYGEEWADMCTERTEEAAEAARVAANEAKAFMAAKAARAADAAEDAYVASYWIEQAIDFILEANEEAAK